MRFLAALLVATAASAQSPPPLGLMDVFEIEYASDPQIAPDGETVVYRRNRLDIQTDRVRGDLWMVNADGSGHQPLVTGVDASGARWSPDGTRLAYVARDADDDDRRHLMVRYLDTGATVPVARLASAPGGVAWAPDGTRLAFTRFVDGERTPLASLPGPPAGASWAQAPIEVEAVSWRSDGSGYVRPGARQLFVVSAEGGTPQAVTDGPYDVDGTPAWTPDGAALVVSSDRRDGAERDPGDSELWRVDVASGRMMALTTRRGADRSPAIGPDGTLAYLGSDDRRLGYQLTNLYVRDGEDHHAPGADARPRHPGPDLGRRPVGGDVRRRRHDATGGRDRPGRAACDRVRPGRAVDRAALPRRLVLRRRRPSGVHADERRAPGRRRRRLARRRRGPAPDRPQRRPVLGSGRWVPSRSSPTRRRPTGARSRAGS